MPTGNVLAGNVIYADDVQDELAAAEGVWTTYPQVWTSTGSAPAFGNATKEYRYKQVGKTVSVYIRIVIGTTTTLGTGQYFFGLPVNGRVANSPMSAYILDTGTSNKSATAWITSTLDAVALTQNITDASATTPQAWAAGDIIEIFGDYEVP